MDPHISVQSADSTLLGCTAELKATFQLPIIGVKKNPQSPMVRHSPSQPHHLLRPVTPSVGLTSPLLSFLQYTQLGVMTKGTVIEVNVSELGMVTTGGKVVWGKYAQITNNPELDGCINGILLV